MLNCKFSFDKKFPLAFPFYECKVNHCSSFHILTNIKFVGFIDNLIFNRLVYFPVGLNCKNINQNTLWLKNKLSGFSYFNWVMFSKESSRKGFFFCFQRTKCVFGFTIVNSKKAESCMSNNNC
jgi:hypothetical protein